MIARALTHLVDIVQGKTTVKNPRSKDWPRVRDTYLAMHPICELCSSSKRLNVHHKVPFHMDPSKELDLTNLITLCESGVLGKNCHLLFGHLGNFKSVNPDVIPDVGIWKMKLISRKLYMTEGGSK